jgi:hypothetical protein
MFKQVFHHRELAPRIVITFQVMAFTRMSAGYPYGIGAFPKSGQCKLGAHAPGTWNANHANIGWVFHATDTSQISRTVAAPVAKEANNFWFPI